VAAVRVASAATVTTEDAFDESLVPRAVSVVEVESLLGVLLSEPERLALRKANGGEPRVAGRIVRKLEDDIDLLERAEGGFRVEEVNQGDDGEVCDGEDDPCTIGNALECDRGDEDDNKVEQPVGTRRKTVSRPSNPKWHDFDLVQPSHTLPSNSEEDGEDEQEHSAGDPSSLHIALDHRYCRIVMSIMHTDMPEAPNIISERRPQKRSIPTTTMNEARK